MRLLSISLLLLLNVFSAVNAAGVEVGQASLIYYRITNKILRPNSPGYAQMSNFVASGQLFEAGMFAANEDSFIDSTVRLWASNLLLPEGDPNLELNDSLAFVMGIARDDEDARTLLTGNFIYGGDPRLGDARPSTANSRVFEILEHDSRKLKKLLHRYQPQWQVSGANDAAGILTTRWWASRNYLIAATNRRAVVSAMNSFMCMPIDGWKRPNLPTYRIRQDIDRFPQGDARIFQTDCRTCHSAMDGLAGAFSKITFDDRLILRWLPQVGGNYLQNADIYPDGYVTTDDSWVNFLRDDPAFGWVGPSEGRGIRSLGQLIANSKAFPRCMVQRAFKSICRKDFDLASPEVQDLADQFVDDGYKIRSLLVRTAVSEACR